MSIRNIASNMLICMSKAQRIALLLVFILLCIGMYPIFTKFTKIFSPQIKTIPQKKETHNLSDYNLLRVGIGGRVEQVNPENGDYMYLDEKSNPIFMLAESNPIKMPIIERSDAATANPNARVPLIIPYFPGATGQINSGLSPSTPPSLTMRALPPLPPINPMNPMPPSDKGLDKSLNKKNSIRPSAINNENKK